MKQTILAVSVGVLVLVALVCVDILFQSGHLVTKLSQAELSQKVQSNLIAKAELIYRPKYSLTNEVRGTFYRTNTDGHLLIQNGRAAETPFSAWVKLNDQLLK